MRDNVIQLFGSDIFGEASMEIAERMKDANDAEGAAEICVTYIGAAARLWAEGVGYPHVQKELAHLAVELERIFSE